MYVVATPSRVPREEQEQVLFAKTLSIYDFRCFGKAVLELQYPGRDADTPLDLPNVNLIVGDNGGGKSSVLRALAIAVLAPALLESGFVPHRLVRRPNAKASLLKVVGQLDPVDFVGMKSMDRPIIELLARIDRRDRGSLDRLHLEKTPSSPIEKLIFDDYSHAFFVAGYGATRRAETGDFSEGSARRSRGLRYQRVAGLFEDHVALRPMQAWLNRIKSPSRRREAIAKLTSMLPAELGFGGKFDEDENQYLFTYDGRQTPFNALSDGYKAYLSWAGDLIGHLCDVAAEQTPIDALSGIVLVDEIDLHLHPAWQRTVVPTIAKAFPRIQFVMTSHSPLITSTLRKENIFVTDSADDGTATIKQLEESVHGRGADQLLLSSYFGLNSTQSPNLEAASKTLFKQAAEGDSGAALAFLEQLSADTKLSQEIVPAVKLALSRAPARRKGSAGKSTRRKPAKRMAKSAK